MGGQVAQEELQRRRVLLAGWEVDGGMGFPLASSCTSCPSSCSYGAPGLLAEDADLCGIFVWVEGRALPRVLVVDVDDDPGAGLFVCFGINEEF